MIKIAITPENIVDFRQEAVLVRTILDAGWTRVHLRHPETSTNDMKRLVEAIPQEYHTRLVLHGHFHLCNHFNFGGLHLNHHCPSAPFNYNGQLSRSCHSVEETGDAKGFEYVTLSPIFDSISKCGYTSRFTPDLLLSLSTIQTPVIALGGVTPERINEIKHYNFSGFAMLGALPWKGTVEDMRSFIEKTNKKTT